MTAALNLPVGLPKREPSPKESDSESCTKLEEETESEEETEDEQATLADDAQFIRTFTMLKSEGGAKQLCQEQQQQQQQPQPSLSPLPLPLPLPLSSGTTDAARKCREKTYRDFMMDAVTRTQVGRAAVERIWGNPTDPDERFLVNYVLQRGWIDEPKPQIEKINKSYKSEKKGKGHECIENENDDPCELDSADEVKAAEDFEHAYNMRYEVEQYGRVVPDSLRRPDERRRQRRGRRAARKLAEIEEQEKIQDAQASDDESPMPTFIIAGYGYRQVAPESHGMTTAEILEASDGELERRMPLDKVIGYDIQMLLGGRVQGRRSICNDAAGRAQKFKERIRRRCAVQRERRARSSKEPVGYSKPCRAAAVSATSTSKMRIDARRLAAYHAAR